MQDGQNGGSLWQAVQPWVQGVVVPIGVALGWAVRWVWAARRQQHHDEEAQRERDDDYRLRDRELLAREQEAAFQRMTAERDRLSKDAGIALAEMNRAWRIAYAVHDFARNQRSDANVIIGQMVMAWAAGARVPEQAERLPPVPEIETFGHAP